ncbi:MAG TPA: hypothetical protein VGJ97_05630 [Anaerolineaceae bacterium]
MNPAIVIGAYNRPAALSRLLGSLRSADYAGYAPIPLVISIDHAAAHPEVARLAQDFAWPYGPKQILPRAEHHGPLGHFYACGGLSAEYGAIVYLEDDLFVSPAFYAFAAQSLAFYAADPCIAGISLYGLWFNGYTRQPFLPLDDGGDAFFIQIPYTQGIAWSGAQWQAYAAWRSSMHGSVYCPAPLHEAWSHFKPDEWFPEYTRYLVSTGKFFAFPRVSLTTGFGDAGTHFAESTRFFQAPLQGAPKEYTLRSLAETEAVYDSFFEILPERLDRLTDLFRGREVTIDLYASRTARNIPTPYVVTTRPAYKAIATFGLDMQPHEANLVYAVPGDEIVFTRTEDLRWDRRAALEVFRRNGLYFARGQRPGIREAVRLWIAQRLKRYM